MSINLNFDSTFKVIQDDLDTNLVSSNSLIWNIYYIQADKMCWL